MKLLYENNLAEADCTDFERLQETHLVERLPCPCSPMVKPLGRHVQ